MTPPNRTRLPIASEYLLVWAAIPAGQPPIRSDRSPIPQSSSTSPESTKRGFARSRRPGPARHFPHNDGEGQCPCPARFFTRRVNLSRDRLLYLATPPLSTSTRGRATPPHAAARPRNGGLRLRHRVKQHPTAINSPRLHKGARDHHKGNPRRGGRAA
jgi:hypothetical protein